jgi:UDP-N-acetylglucosamine/UDP-N-acetylgalactosamine 4-epimerase
MRKLKNSKILVTGGAGFIGSNLIEHFLRQNNEVVCLDDLSTGHKKNITPYLKDPNFQMIEGDIRKLETCKLAVRDCEYVFHQAALGSVPRSIIDPVTTNAVNIDGFLNILMASRDEQVTRFIYAASSSTYGDSIEVPKVESRTGRPLSPYAITKVVNEYFAQVFSELYGMETIGLRYFNVFGRRQDPNGAYAAVIPLWVKCLVNHESPTINGDGSYSRDFTYIDNVIQANELAAITPSDRIRTRLKNFHEDQLENGAKLPNQLNPVSAVMDVFNVAYGSNTTLLQLFDALRKNLMQYDSDIGKIEVKVGPKRTGDIPHSLASIDKIKMVLGYNPKYSAETGFKEACQWYYQNLL